MLSRFYFDTAWVVSARGLMEGDVSCLSFVKPVSVQQRWIMSFIACYSFAVALKCDYSSLKAVIDALR